MFQVRAGRELILSQGTELDVLICFNQEAYDLHAKDLKKRGGCLVYDSNSCVPPQNAADFMYGFPASDLARQEMHSYLTKNILFLGVLAKLFNFPYDKIEEIIKQRFAKKGEAVLGLNTRALKYGYDYAGEKFQKKDPYQLGRRDSDNRMVISGNQALALGAITAGCRFYAGYPITPATDIMEWLSRELPRFGGAVVQAEDEIAALSMVLGASYGGVKAMTATSGPGFSLMQELIGLASMAEMPCVIVDVQRAGPSTGMPTKTEQSDLQMALYGSHGEAFRIVMGLTSVEDSFYGIIRAFNYAVRCQCPVIVLSDQYLGHRTATIPKPDITRVLIEDRKKPSAEELKNYKRYLMTETGVSPMAIPGEKGGLFTATGLEHDESGDPNFEPKNHQEMQEKRRRKLRLVSKGSDLFRTYGAENPDVGIVGWGSSEGAIREVVDLGARAGIKVGAFHTKLLNPLPEREIGEFVGSCKRVVVPELNLEGQFARVLRAKFQKELISVNKVTGLPFTPKELLDRIDDISHRIYHI